ncbi:MAG: SRPBCC domain-containing protein [Chloroflexi bacterium]|nr:SRPBCC domain-containing protein [Chloroflexota bacterium]
MHFEERIEVQTGKAEVWKFLWDVERVARCMPGCQEVREVSPGQRYEVVIEERMGPFKIRFDMEVEVLERKEEELVRLRAEGSDRKLGTNSRGELEVRLEGLDSGATALDITADIQVTGKIASLGQVAIKRKAQSVVQKFAETLAAELESEARGK